MNLNSVVIEIKLLKKNNYEDLDLTNEMLVIYIVSDIKEKVHG